MTACVGARSKAELVDAPQVFYEITGEIALARGEPRVAAAQYAKAASLGINPDLLHRAADVAQQSLQPTLTAEVAARWIALEPGALEAHRAAARAALSLHRIAQSADQYRIVLTTSPRGEEAEFKDLETELASVENIFGARQLADRLAASFPTSSAALRLQGFAALRADDPAAAVTGFSAALALPPRDAAEDREARAALVQALWRARILAGDSDQPLAESKALASKDATPANELDYALLLLAAQKNDAAIEELELIARQPDAAPVALRLLGLIEFQEGKHEEAGRRFTELLTMGKFIDDSFYYLGLIAERSGDLERALRLYAQVQNGDNSLAALLRACTIMQNHGAAPAAQELLDHLIEDEPQRAPEIVAARARIYADAGDAPRAFQVLDQGLEDYPDSVDIRYAMASAYEEHGRLAEALRELESVLKSRPDDPAALNAYGYTLADHKKELPRARSLIERAYAMAPKNAAILDSLGWVLFRQGHTDQALPYLNAAYADDRGGDIAAHLGEVLWQLGRRADADRIWTEAQASDAENHLLNETRQRLHSASK